jgi:hypothetical protein
MKPSVSFTSTPLIRIRASLVLAIGLTGLVVGAPAAWAQAPIVAGPAGVAAVMGTAFTYQGQLIAGGAPVNYTYVVRPACGAAWVDTGHRGEFECGLTPGN